MANFPKVRVVAIMLAVIIVTVACTTLPGLSPAQPAPPAAFTPVPTFTPDPPQSRLSPSEIDATLAALQLPDNLANPERPATLEPPIFTIELPTFEPPPTIAPFPTHPPISRITPNPLLEPKQFNPSPTSTPEQVTFYEVGDQEAFHGAAFQEAQRGDELFDKGLFIQAAAAFESAQTHHGEPSSVLQNRIALAYERAGQTNKAIEHYSLAIAIEESSTGRTNRADIYRTNGRCDHAINDAQIALTLEQQSTPGFNTHTKAHQILSACRLELGDAQTSLHHAKQALQSAQQHSYTSDEIAEIHFMVAIGYTDSNQISTAVQHYSQAIALDDQPLYRTFRGWVNLNNGIPERARLDAEIALEMVPTIEIEYHSHAEAHQILAIYHLDNEAFQAAIENVQAAIPLMRAAGYPADEVQEWTDFIR